ncbi:MAG: SRPBCC domain-containing protein [Chloroflexi bacterium]|nr:SRPBCC domain-containing protein [Chloroflexota bacterium]
MNSIMEIRRSVVVAADREKVWRAITQPEQFSKWFGDRVQFDRLAAGEAMTFFVGDETGPGIIAIVEPPERFAFHWTAEPGYPVETLVTFHLETVPEGTRITVTETGFEALPEEVRHIPFERNNEGWGIQMDNIAAYLQAVDNV